MKNLLILGAALLGLCSFGHAARAGGDDYEDHSYRRHDYYQERHDDCEEPRVVVRHYCPPPRVYVDECAPRVVVREGYYGYPHPYYRPCYHRRPHVSFFLGF